MKTERDSIYVRDSIFINQYTSGDTIFRDKEVFNIEYRDKIKLDTVFVHDSIRVPVTKYVKEKQKKHNWKYLLGCLTPIIIYILYKILRKKFFLLRHS